MATAQLKGILSLDNIGFVRGIKSSIDWSKRLAGELRSAGLGQGAGLLAMKGLDLGLKGAAAGFRELAGIAKNALGVVLGIQLAKIGNQAVKFGQSSVQAAAQTEDWTIKMRGLGVSARDADHELSELRTFSLKGFDLGTLEEIAEKLQIAGGAGLNTIKTFEMIGDTARKRGVDIKELGDIVASTYKSLKEGTDISASLDTLKEQGVLTQREAARIENLSKQAGKGAAAYRLFTESLKKFKGGINETNGSLTAQSARVKAQLDSLKATVGGWLSGGAKKAAGITETVLSGIGLGLHKAEELVGTSEVAPAKFAPHISTPADAFEGAMEIANNISRGPQARHFTGAELNAYFAANHQFTPGANLAPITGLKPTLGERLFSPGYREGHPLGSGTMLTTGHVQGASGLTSGGLSGGAYNQTPLLPASVRRAMESANRARLSQIRAGAGIPEDAGREIRFGDRSRLHSLERAGEAQEFSNELLKEVQDLNRKIPAMQ